MSKTDYFTRQCDESLLVQTASSRFGLTAWRQRQEIDYVVFSVKMAEMPITKTESATAWTS